MYIKKFVKKQFGSNSSCPGKAKMEADVKAKMENIKIKVFNK